MAFIPTIEEKKKQPPKAAPKPAKQKLEAEKIVLEEERVYRTGAATVRDLIAPAAMKIEPNLVRLGDVYARTIFVVTYPRYISVGWAAPILNLNTSLDIGMFFYPVKAEIILKQLKKKVGTLEATIMAAAEKGAARDPLRETALRDIEKLRDDLTQGVEHFFQFAFYVTVYAPKIEQLDKITEEIESIFGSKLIYTKRVYFQAEQGFNSTLPLGNDELMISFNMNSSPIASSFPFISSDVTSDNGVLYGINRHNNSLILFDRFSLQNANMSVFATSGAGKSVSADTEVLIKDKSGKVKLAKIGEVVDSLGEKNLFQPIEEEIEGVVNPGLFVYTFDKDLKGEWSPVTVAARKIAPESLYIFCTRSGRSITVTGDHNMLVLRDGQVIAAKSAEVREGESIPVPQSIPEPAVPTRTLDLLTLLANSPHLYLDGCRDLIAANFEKIKAARLNPVCDKYLLQYSRGRRLPISYFWQIAKYLGQMPDNNLRVKINIGSGRHRQKDTTLSTNLELKPSFLRLLGYIVSEGTVMNKYILISNLDKEVRQDIKDCLQELGLTYFNRRSDGSYVLTSRVFLELMKALGVTGKAGEKSVPPLVFNLDNALAAQFLRAYFEGDGGVEKNAVTACSKSQKLISDLSYLLLRFGIVARSTVKTKTATNSGATGRYGILTISGQDNLRRYQEHINFVTRRKQQLLAGITGRQANTNVDLIPVQSIFKELYDLFAPQLHGLQAVIELKNGSYEPSRGQLVRVISQIEERVEYFEGLKEEFVNLSVLPELAEIVREGTADAEKNRLLWSRLGQSWRLMKRGEVASRAVNVFKAAGVVYARDYSLAAVKENIHQGFKELSLSVKDFDRNLSHILVGGAEENTDYGVIYNSAQRVWQGYQQLQKNLPKVRFCLKKLKRLARADLFWDPIAKIVKIKNTDKFVYDLTVDNEVFLAGQGGLFVHNSYFVKLEVLRSLMLGTDVIIIDPEMEYKHLCEAVGGTYISISLASETKINPFDLPRSVGGDAKTEDIIRGAVITVKGLMRLLMGKLTTAEDSLVDRALLETYAKKDITPESDLSTVEPPIMSDFADILSGMEGGAELTERLKKYTEGTFAGLFNAPTNVDIKNQLVVFSVRDLEDELRPMAIYSIINYIWNVVRSEVKKRLLIIDEAWWLMQQEDSAKFIYALVKRCRKYYLGVTTITQDVNDFLTSIYGQAIVNNSALQVLFKQTPSAIDNIAKTFMLTQGEKYLLLESGVGEGIFFAGQKHAAIKVVASYTEDQLITTDPRQLLEIEQAKKEFEAQQATAGAA